MASEKKNIIRQVENKAPNNAANVASANSVAEIRCNQYGVSSIILEEIPSMIAYILQRIPYNISWWL